MCVELLSYPEELDQSRSKIEKQVVVLVECAVALTAPARSLWPCVALRSHESTAACAHELYLAHARMVGGGEGDVYNGCQFEKKSSL